MPAPNLKTPPGQYSLKIIDSAGLNLGRVFEFFRIATVGHWVQHLIQAAEISPLVTSYVRLLIELKVLCS